MSRFATPPSQREHRRADPPAPPTQAPPQPPPVLPRRWEYTVARVPVDGTGLNVHGADGWEAVGVIDSRIDSLSVLLKREVPHDPTGPVRGQDDAAKSR